MWQPGGCAPPGPPAGYLGQDESNEVLTGLCELGRAVQAGTPMTAQGESAVPPPPRRPEARRRPVPAPAFILAQISPPEAPAPSTRAVLRVV